MRKYVLPIIFSALISMVSFPTMQAFADDPFIIFDGVLLEDPFGNTGNTTFSGQFDFDFDPAYVPFPPIYNLLMELFS